MQSQLPLSWSNKLSKEFTKDYFYSLNEKVEGFYNSTQNRIFPSQNLIFNAFNLCHFENVKVVILGQDPYPTFGNANGLCFSVSNNTTNLPKSLKNILIEVKNDIGDSCIENGVLEPWAKQGVLLLNSILTVEEGKPNSHSKIGWEQFTDSVIKVLSAEKSNLVFILWGSKAIAKREIIDSDKHLILTAPHPSPLSVYRGFFGCKHFSITNLYFRKLGVSEISW